MTTTRMPTHRSAKAGRTCWRQHTGARRMQTLGVLLAISMPTPILANTVTRVKVRPANSDKSSCLLCLGETIPLGRASNNAIVLPSEVVSRHQLDLRMPDSDQTAMVSTTQLRAAATQVTRTAGGSLPGIVNHSGTNKTHIEPAAKSTRVDVPDTQAQGSPGLLDRFLPLRNKKSQAAAAAPEPVPVSNDQPTALARYLGGRIIIGTEHLRIAALAGDGGHGISLQHEPGDKATPHEPIIAAPRHEKVALGKSVGITGIEIDAAGVDHLLTIAADESQGRIKIVPTVPLNAQWQRSRSGTTAPLSAHTEAFDLAFGDTVRVSASDGSGQAIDLIVDQINLD